jgi:hypothetical protein
VRREREVKDPSSIYILRSSPIQKVIHQGKVSFPGIDKTQRKIVIGN